MGVEFFEVELQLVTDKYTGHSQNPGGDGHRVVGVSHHHIGLEFFYYFGLVVDAPEKVNGTSMDLRAVYLRSNSPAPP